MIDATINRMTPEQDRLFPEEMNELGRDEHDTGCKRKMLVPAGVEVTAQIEGGTATRLNTAGKQDSLRCSEG